MKHFLSVAIFMLPLLIQQQQCDFDVSQFATTEVVNGIRPYFPAANIVDTTIMVDTSSCILMINTGVSGVSKLLVEDLSRQLISQEGSKLRLALALGGYTAFVLEFNGPADVPADPGLIYMVYLSQASNAFWVFRSIEFFPWMFDFQC